MNRLIELHDSRVGAIAEVGTQIILFLRAYLHCSEERPGIDAGTGWIQAAAIVFDEAVIEGKIPELPATVGDGSFKLDGRELPNEIPVPLDQSGEISLALSLYNDTTNAKVLIQGNKANLILLGEAAYVEDFTP